AASELARLGVWSRGGARPRGSLTTTATERLPQPTRMQSIIQCLDDAAPRVRGRVALALGEWGGQEAAAAVARRLESETDEEATHYYIVALRLLGGPTATDALRRTAAQGNEATRDAALADIEELATGGHI